MATDAIAWALDLLAAHNIPALAEDEDARRLIGELVSLGWDVSWDEDFDYGDPVRYEAGVRVYTVRARAAWLPVGVVKFEVEGQDLGEAALALELQGTRG